MKSALARLRCRLSSKKSESTSLPLFLTQLNFDCRVIIYEILVVQELHVECHQRSRDQSHLARLAHSCTFLRDEIKRWYSLKIKQSWLTTMSAAKLGIFAPETTIFHFNFRDQYKRTLNPFKRREQMLARGGLYHRLSKAPEFDKIQHLVIHNEAFTRSYWYCLSDLGALVKPLKQLQSIVFVSHVKDVKKSAKRNSDLCCELWDMWMVFWAAAPFCHPKKCCSCCILPELKWTVDRNGEKLSGEVPFWHTIPNQPSSWFRFEWTVYNMFPDFDDYGISSNIGL